MVKLNILQSTAKIQCFQDKATVQEKVIADMRERENILNTEVKKGKDNIEKLTEKLNCQQSHLKKKIEVQNLEIENLRQTVHLLQMDLEHMAPTDRIDKH